MGGLFQEEIAGIIRRRGWGEDGGESFRGTYDFF